MADGPADAPPTGEAAQAPLGRDELEEALRFVHQRATEMLSGQAELGASVQALVDTLVAHGVVPTAEYARRRQRALERAQLAMQDSETPPVRLGDDVDKYALADLPAVDCAALIPICEARCCRLTVYCSRQDLDERVLHWDYSRPYQIRKREDGYCVHSEPTTFACSVYGKRPAICRTYDCRDDARIWQDFARRILADEG